METKDVRAMLDLIAEPKELSEMITRCINDHAVQVGHLEILEAGCGRRWPFRLEQVDYTLIGVDTDRDALESRQKLKKDLDSGILGDLRTVELTKDQFDVIYSSFVLEHIDGAKQVLENFLHWLKPGGLMILTFPDRDSVYGFFTRVTPFWIHVLYKRYFFGEKNAGRSGFGPYPTFHDPVISRAAFRQFTCDHGLVILKEYGFGTLPRFQTLFTKLIQALSFGRLDSRHRNLVYVLQNRKQT